MQRLTQTACTFSLHQERAGQAAVSLVPVSSMDQGLLVTQNGVQIPFLPLISSVTSGTLRFSEVSVFHL